MAKKTFSRNEQATFIASFYTDSTYTTAVEPISASYPSYSIINPEGDIIESGTAVSYDTAGKYKVIFTIPDNALLSTDNDGWFIEWTMVSSDNRQLQYKENFLVVDARVETPMDTSIIQVAPEGEPFRIINYFETNPTYLKADIYPSKNTTTAVATIESTGMTGPISENGHIGYYADVDGFTQGDYLIIWSYRNSELSEMSREFKTIRIIRTTILRFVDQLRILIDRFQKRQSAPNAYSDSDLIEFLNKGLEMVNAWYPSCDPLITWDDVDGTAYPIYVIACAAIYGLRSQYLLENDLSFNFCLDMDSYVNTNEGLIQLKNLGKGFETRDLIRDTFYKFRSDEDRKVIESVVSKVPDGIYYETDIIEYANLSKNAQQLELLFNQLCLSKYRTSDGNGRFEWTINDSFRNKAIKNCGFATSEQYSDFTSDYELDTPLGLQHPGIVFNLGKKKVRKLVTENGTQLVCTNNHPSLVLTDDLDLVEKKAEDIKEGDYVVINRTKEEIRDYDIDFSNIISKIPTSPTENKVSSALDSLTLPTKLTKELSRVLGYLSSEGSITTHTIKFFNKEKELLDDYSYCFKKCFNVELKESINENGIVCLCCASSKLSRFFNTIGLKITTSYYVRIPWCIMKAPLSLAKEYIQTYFEGDGCYYPGSVIFSSSSPKLKSDLQLLLLRFGIISKYNAFAKAGKVTSVNVRGNSLKIYANEIGFWRKGNGKHTTYDGNTFTYKESDCFKDENYNSHIESLPKKVLKYIKELRTRNNLGEWIEINGVNKRLEISMDKYHSIGSNYLTYDELENYLDNLGNDIDYVEHELYERLKVLVKYRFNFERVVYNKQLKKKRVVGDPFLQDIKNEDGTRNKLSHFFVCNGIVTHNSGLTTTLDYDRTGNIETSMAGLLEFVNTNLTKTKTATAYSTGIGSVFVRPYSVYQNARNLVIPYSSSTLGNQGSSIWDLMVILGL